MRPTLGFPTIRTLWTGQTTIRQELMVFNSAADRYATSYHTAKYASLHAALLDAAAVYRLR